MGKSKRHLQSLLDIHYKNLLVLEEQIARQGMNYSLPLFNEKVVTEEQISILEAELDKLGDTEENLISPQETDKNKFLVRQKLYNRLIKLKEFKEIAQKIRDFAVQQHNTETKDPVAPHLSEKFSYLYAEVAPYMRDILIDLGFEEKQISESIMKFINTSLIPSYNFLLETNQGLSFIQMALRGHEVMEKEIGDEAPPIRHQSEIT